ncbi:coagulation factor XIII A chain [Puntigrus tetrazona]|uniref:coagulation factor XIII A chain n=1 Tax=Puntigrus tetrazona TaxID=1606681 RepID=UPI001C8A8B5B|nr:coagulation factor XIII A chain [Puntigrus tetrazona]
MSHQHSETQSLQLQSGRISIAKSNFYESNLPEYEAFDALRPRGPTDKETQASGLSVLSVDMLVTKNEKDHTTDKYKCSTLIVRRNKEFTIVIKLDRAFNAEQDDVQIEFVIGSAPDENKGTHIIVSIGKEKRTASWKGRVVETQGNDVTVGITPDSSCIVGRFRTFVTVVTELGKQRTPRNPDTDFYVLFNSWDSADEAYMDKEEDRQEYVMNDVGTIYYGEFNNIVSRSWNFGQFEEGVLDACLMLLDAGKVPLLFRGNATEVVRQGSALINAQDDDGLLVGNWSGDYSEGTAPTAWTGSPEILLKYAKQGCVPVRFAQCWVFAGVLNTLMRCLGIPARLITNFISAHDNTGNLKTDIVLDDDGKVDRSRTRDSVWNYHCWNEVYIKRLDLPEKYSGWQVIDSTPQETSDGLYRCGPTSVNAIKEGELSYPFDAKFVFAEMNSDVIFRKCDKSGKIKIIYVDSSYVGKLLVTKKKDSSEYEDITSNYKYPEGSLKERESMQMAEHRGVSKDHLPLPEAGVDLELQADTIKMGDNFKLKLNIKNQMSQTCTFSAIITGCVVYYTGVTSTTFKLENMSATVEASKTESLTIDVNALEYMPYLVEQSNLLFVAYGYIEEKDASVSIMRVVTLSPPELTIKMVGTPQVGKEVLVSVIFQNPYNFILEKVQLRIEGPGLIITKLKKYSQILPGASVKYKVSLFPRSPGKKVLMACLDCPLLRQVTNQLEFEVANN